MEFERYYQEFHNDFCEPKYYRYCPAPRVYDIVIDNSKQRKVKAKKESDQEYKESDVVVQKGEGCRDIAIHICNLMA